jgi:hypothetical protein
MELGRVSVLSFDGTVLYEQFVMPENKVIDWRTFISGCDEEKAMSQGVTPNEARDALCRIIGPDTIVVGHALNHDLHTMKIKHDRVIDTAFLFPAKQKRHKQTRRMSLPLRYLMHCLVEGKYPDSFDLDSNQIDRCNGQADEPHDSMEDARWALELALGAMKALGTGGPLDHTTHIKNPYLVTPSRPRAIGINNLPIDSEEPLRALVAAAATHAPPPCYITPPCYALKTIRTPIKKMDVVMTDGLSSNDDIQEADSEVDSEAVVINDRAASLSTGDADVEYVTEIVPMGVSNLLFSTTSARDKFFNTFIMLLGATRQVRLYPLPEGTTSGELIGELVKFGSGPVLSARIPDNRASGGHWKKGAIISAFITLSEPEYAYKLLGLPYPSMDSISTSQGFDGALLSLMVDEPARITLKLGGRKVNLTAEAARVQEFTTPVPFFKGSPRLHILRK